MSDYSYLRPKVAKGNMGERPKTRGMFQNVGSYPEFGGFSGPSKVPSRGRPLSLEKGDLTRKGKPI